MQSTSIERRIESPSEVEDQQSESFAGDARGFAKQNVLYHEVAHTQIKS